MLATVSVMLETVLKVFQTSSQQQAQLARESAHHVTLNEAQRGRAVCWYYHGPVICNVFEWPSARYLADCSQQVAARVSKAPGHRHPEHGIRIAVKTTWVHKRSD